MADARINIPTIAELNSLLQQKRRNENDDAAHLAFLQAGMLYFVEGNALCWWCNKDTREAATGMLHLFSIKETEQIKKYKDALAEQLTKCDKCILAYYYAKHILRMRYSKQYDSQLVESFFQDIEGWDSARITKMLAIKTLVSNNAGRSVSIRFALIDALSDSINILFNQEIATTTIKHILAYNNSGKVLNLDGQPLPGLFALSFCDNKDIQQWAWMSLKLAVAKDPFISFSMVEPVFIGILNQLTNQAGFKTAFPAPSAGCGNESSRITFLFSTYNAWHGMRVVISRLSDQLKIELIKRFDKLHVFICQWLQRLHGSEFIEALRAFAYIISTMDKEQIWPQISRDTGCSPTDFVQRIMSHPDICAIFQTEIQDLASVDTLTEKALLAQNRQLKPILEWITPFIESLKLPGDSQAIVTLLTELLFTMRNNPKVPLVRKALAAHTAMAIITHCVKLPFAKRFLDDGKFLLSDFLQSNFHIIADIAQNRNELSSSELLISGAEELIELMLREDLSYTFKAISEISETAQKISDAPEMLADSGAQEKCSVPILIHFPALWDSVLMDPQNTNVVRKAIYGVSYLLLYDHLPSSLIRYLPQAWREAYLQFETKRSGLADLLEQLLQLLAAGLSTVDPVTRSEFEREILPSLLRLLLSPSKYTNSIILQLMNISSFDLSDSELVVSQPNKNSSINSTAKRSNNLSDSERDLVCNELFERHQYSFIQALTEIVNDCRVLVNCSRPAYTCSGNIALYARSSIYAVSNLSGSNVSETVVKLFFAFCSLLGSILKANSNNAMQIGNRSIYMDSVLIVFNTVYDMLNSLEFAGFVRMVKASSSLSEDEAMDALSMCVSQMLNYLEGKDPLGVSGRIIRMFGLIASGLAATPGTSMLYPVETVRALINGSSGRLTPDMRKLLKEITSKSVWEPRSIAINKTKPVQIVIDDEDAFAAMDELDLSDVLEVSFDPQACTDPIVAIDSPKTGYWADIDTHNQKAKDKTGGMARSPGAGSVSLENVKVTQFTSDDASHIKIRKQTSMKDWVSRVASKCDSLTAKLNQEPSSAVNSSSSSSSSVAARTKKQDKSNGLFTQIRSAFVNERKGIALDTRQIVPKIPKQVVKAPRSLATVPVDLWHSDKNHDSRVIEPDGDPMYIRDVSEVALKELEKERGKGSAKQPIYTISDDDGSSSSDESGDEAKPSGLAGLIKIPKSQTGKSQPRRIMRMVSVAGEIVAGGSRFNNTANLAGQFFDPSARDKALAEQRTKMRLAPSMNQLYKKLLGWRYEDVGDCPPDIRASDLRKIPDTFDNCDSYNNVFEPLMLLESWSQFQRSKEESENKDTGEASLESRIGVDDFQEITFRITMADTDMFAECDVLVFAETLAQQKRMAQGLLKDQHNSTIKISKRFAGRHTFLAMVKKKTYGRDGADVIVRAYFQGARLAQSLNKLTLNSCWEFINLYTMTPVQREYSALRSLAYLDEHIVDEILHPRVSSRRPALSHAEVRQLMEIHALNQPQAEAVAAAIKQEHGFTLIQGPPGTGKTKTILGLSGVLVSDSKDRKDPVSSALFNSSENSDGNVARLTRNKLLICAPSNAAVDEIVKRLKNGIRDNTGSTFYPRVVRVGQSESISSTVKDTTLDFLLDKALNSFDSNLRSKNSNFTKDMSDQQSSLLLDIAGQRRREDGKAVAEAASAKENQKEAQESVRSLRTQLDEANQEIRELDAQMQKVDVSDTIAMRNLRDKYYESKQKKQMITQKLTLERERVRNTGKAIDETKAKIRMQILQKTDILCCTLSGSGHEMMASLNCTFETVIIDEAAQSIELSCLIPMKYGCKRCILVGDPNQLPPTVFSQTAMQQLYNQSIFVRIQKNAPNVVNLLSIQYRMHPEISVFPSRLFYESRLKDGPEMAAKQRAPWHNSKNYPPFMFFNISSGKEQMGMSRSVFNMDEVMAAVQLVYSLCTDFPDLPWKQRIGVITPYKQQLRKLVETFKQFFGELAKEAIEFNTVDGFQGQEKDIIIFSCVRAGEGGVGFLSDKRRMNVGLTRARKSLFVLGNAKLLAASPLWKQLIDDSSARGLLLDSPLPLFGRHAQRGTRIDGLLKDISDGAKNSIDGEGDRAEFIMEPINEDSLNSIGEAIAETKIGGGDESNPGLKESSVSVKDGYSSEKRKHQVLSESNRVHDQKPDSRTHIAEPTDRQKKRRLSEEKQLDGLNERRARSISSSSSSAAPHVCVRPPSRPPMDLQAQIAANREKQRSALFIPKKRGGREGSSSAATSAVECRKASNELPMLSESETATNTKQQTPPPPSLNLPPPSPPKMHLRPPFPPLPPPSSTSRNAGHLPNKYCEYSHRNGESRQKRSSNRHSERSNDSGKHRNEKNHRNASSSRHSERSDDKDKHRSRSNIEHESHSKHKSSSSEHRSSDKYKKRRPGLFRPSTGYDSAHSTSSRKRGKKDHGSDDTRDDLISNLLSRR